MLRGHNPLRTTLPRQNETEDEALAFGIQVCSRRISYKGFCGAIHVQPAELPSLSSQSNSEEDVEDRFAIVVMILPPDPD